MNQNSVKVIGIKDEEIKDTVLSHLNQVEGLKETLNRDFIEWVNFDNWESILVQQWIFFKALDVYKGKKIAIKCDCCEYVDSLKSDFEEITKEKCYGKKCAYMIVKVVDEIALAQAKRASDGTYSA